MPFDPNIPAQGAPNSSAQMRAQLNSLNDKIDAVPAGPPGPAGPQGETGPPFAQAMVDGVNTLEPGQPATVEVTFDGTDVHFVYGIPRGADGPQGETGPPGEVTPTQLNDAIVMALEAAANNSSANTNNVPTIDTPMADPDAEILRQAFNTLVLMLRR